MMSKVWELLERVLPPAPAGLLVLSPRTQLEGPSVKPPLPELITPPVSPLHLTCKPPKCWSSYCQTTCPSSHQTQGPCSVHLGDPPEPSTGPGTGQMLKKYDDCHQLSLVLVNLLEIAKKQYTNARVKQSR